MFGFRDFLNEGGYHVPVVSISKDKVDLSKDKTRDEVNRNLSASLSREWINPYSGLLVVSKILSMYGVTLPKIILDDDVEGEIIIVISQFGEKIGANLDGTIDTFAQPDNDELYLVYEYGLSEKGFIEAFATVVTEEELDAMLDKNDEGQLEDEEGDLDPRQK